MPRVTFEPGLRTIDVERGERLLVAAWRAGTALKSVCGGRGKCGTCLIEVADEAALSPPHATERALLPAGADERRYRLACLAHVEHDVTVRVPPESEAVRSPPRKPFTVARIPAAPLVSSVTVDIDGACDTPLRPLAARIESALDAARVGKRIELPVPALAALSAERQFDIARRVTVTLHAGREAIRVRPGAHRGLFGLALDIGTTSVVAFLCDLEAATIIGVRTATNPQAAYGEDVISRMTHIQRDIALLPRLQSMVVDEISRMAAELAAEAAIAVEDIVDVVAVGNPTMQHILLGINPEPLGRAPYLPVLGAGVEARAGEIGLKVLRQARVFVLPMVSGYIGGDTLAAVLTRDRDFYRGNQLLIDVGTNGEVVLAADGALTATSCATGPVYEGAHIRCGVRASPGAIERIWFDATGEIACGVIPDPHRRAQPRPVGLCGSGVISAVAALNARGIVRGDGRIVPDSHAAVRPEANGRGCEVLLAPARRSATGRDIVLTQADVRSVQLGKAALRAGIELLLRDSGVRRIDRMLLAGTFGNHLDPSDILRIGMVPPVPVQAIQSIGNAAGDGARMALFNRHHRARARALAQRVRVVELTCRPDFQDLFVSCTALTPQLPADEPALA